MKGYQQPSKAEVFNEAWEDIKYKLSCAKAFGDDGNFGQFVLNTGISFIWTSMGPYMAPSVIRSFSTAEKYDLFNKGNTAQNLGAKIGSNLGIFSSMAQAFTFGYLFHDKPEMYIFPVISNTWSLLMEIGGAYYSKLLSRIEEKHDLNKY